MNSHVLNFQVFNTVLTKEMILLDLTFFPHLLQMAHLGMSTPSFFAHCPFLCDEGGYTMVYGNRHMSIVDNLLLCSFHRKMVVCIPLDPMAYLVLGSWGP